MSKQGSPFHYKKIPSLGEDGQTYKFNSRDPIGSCKRKNTAFPPNNFKSQTCLIRLDSQHKRVDILY